MPFDQTVALIDALNCNKEFVWGFLNDLDGHPLTQVAPPELGDAFGEYCSRWATYLPELADHGMLDLGTVDWDRVGSWVGQTLGSWRGV